MRIKMRLLSELLMPITSHWLIKTAKIHTFRCILSTLRGSVTLWLHGKKEKMKELIRPNIRNLQAYSSARDEFSGKKGVFLDANENPFGHLNRYPDPHQKDLKAQLAQLKGLSSEHIFIGNGSDEVIDLAFRIFCEPGKDKVLSFFPSYGMYRVSAAINDIKLIEIPLATNFQIDVRLLKAYFAQKDIKLLFICSPNNPTGNVFHPKDIKFILNHFKGITIIDEAYIDFSSSPSWSKEIDNYPRLIVSQTFSKAWGLAAARVGVAYANDEIINLFDRVKPPYNVSALNQNAAIKAITNIDIFEQNKQTILAERQLLQQELVKFDWVKHIYPSDANFLLIQVTNANIIYSKLVKQNVIIRNRHNLVENCIRISIGTPTENRILLQTMNTIEI